MTTKQKTVIPLGHANLLVLITKVVKKEHPDNSLTGEAKVEVNALLNGVAEALVAKAAAFARANKSKLLSSGHILAAASSMSLEDIARKAAKKASAVGKVSASFAPRVRKSVVDKVWGGRVQKEGVLLLVEIIVELCSRIVSRALEWKNASKLQKNKDRRSITSSFIWRGINGDEELCDIFMKSKIRVSHSSAIQRIDKRLVPTKAEQAKKARLRAKSRKESGRVVDKMHPRKTHDALGLSEIKRYQNFSAPLIPTAPFRRFVTAVFHTMDYNRSKTAKDFLVGKNALNALREGVEHHTVLLLRRSNGAALHAGRKRVDDKDIEFADDSHPRSCNRGYGGRSHMRASESAARKELTGAAIKRLARKAGVMGMTAKALEAVRLHVNVYCHDVIMETIDMVRAGKRKAIREEDFLLAFKSIDGILPAARNVRKVTVGKTAAIRTAKAKHLAKK